MAKMENMKNILKSLPLLAVSTIFIRCSEAPEIHLPEPSNRTVLAEFFTEDG